MQETIKLYRGESYVMIHSFQTAAGYTVGVTSSDGKDDAFFNVPSKEDVLQLVKAFKLTGLVEKN